jgi:hypothetical protein
MTRSLDSVPSRRQAATGLGLALALCAALATAPSVAQPLALGNQFRVDEAAQASLSAPQLTATGEEFVATWGRFSPGSSGRRIGYDGPLDSGFELPFPPSDLAGGPGWFWATAQEFMGGTSADVYLQRFSDDGTPLSLLIQVNQQPGEGMDPRAVMAPDGSLMVVWWNISCGDSSLSCFPDGAFGRGFLPGGVPSGDAFGVGSGDGLTRAAAGLPGEFVVAHKSSTYPDGETAHAQRYALDGSPVGKPFDLDEGFELARLTSGDFVVVWATFSPDPREIRVRRFDPLGTPRGPAVAVASCSSCILTNPGIGAGQRDDFLVVWNEWIGGGERRLMARLVGPSGLLSDAVAINATGEPDLVDLPVAEIASGPDGRFLLAWESDDGASQYSIQARAVASPFLFEDGFESGDTAAWSQTVP